MGAIFKRELAGYFRSPIGYIFMGLFLLVSGLLFTGGNLFSGSSNFSSFLGSIMFIYIFAIPLLTMRLISEDRRQRTDQLLLTAPIKVYAIVLGKFFAALVVFLITLAVTVLYTIVIAIWGDLAVAETVGAYIGFTFLGTSFISIGVLISAVTDSQVTSAFFTFFALLFVWLIDLVRQIVPQDTAAGLIFAAVAVIGVALYFWVNTRNLILAAVPTLVGAAAIVVGYLVNPFLYQTLINSVLDWFSLLQRYNAFTLGIFRLDSVVYYLSFTALFLFITVRLIERRRWA